jgi:methanogenic corrinoid protein MtbC1
MGTITDNIPIAVVEQETGLSKDVLRKWETRYGYPIPGRNEHGDRVYSRDQVTRLTAIQRLMDGGYRPSTLFGMDADALTRLTEAPAAMARETNAQPSVAAMLDLLKAHQPATLRAALKRELQGQGLRHFVQDTIAPLSMAVGDAWSRGELRIFEEHLFSDIAAATLRQAMDALDSPEGRPRILMTTPPGETHTLGLLMAACLFTLRGAHCIYLGADTPLGDIAHAARAHDVDAIGLSFSSAYPARRIKPTLLDLRQQIPNAIDILAGGHGIKRQKPLDGIILVKDDASIDAYVGGHARDQAEPAALPRA